MACDNGAVKLPLRRRDRREEPPTGGSSGSPRAGADGAARVRTVRAVVSGRVQGVGFRWYCEQEASALGLDGTVLNREDGDVEVVAQGPADDVSRLIAWLYHGPEWARVTGVAITELKPGSLRRRGFRTIN